MDLLSTDEAAQHQVLPGQYLQPYVFCDCHLQMSSLFDTYTPDYWLRPRQSTTTRRRRTVRPRQESREPVTAWPVARALSF